MIWFAFLFILSLINPAFAGEEHHQHTHHLELSEEDVAAVRGLEIRIAAVEAAHKAGHITTQQRDAVVAQLQTRLQQIQHPHEEHEAHDHEERDPGGAHRRTTHEFKLGLNFDLILASDQSGGAIWVDHADPMFGWGINSCWDNGGCISTTIAIGIGPNRKFLPSYLLDMEIHLPRGPWIGFEVEGHLNHDDDEGLHTHPPNVLLSAGGGAGNLHVGGGFDLFHTQEDRGHGFGPALVLGYEFRNMHLHGHVSVGSRTDGGFASRASVHMTIALGGKGQEGHHH